VYRIHLGNDVFEGANAVYLFDAPQGPTTLVDAGANAAPIREDLTDGLSEAGVAPADVDRILLTHFHGDHSGLATWLRAESGATVHVGTADAPMVARAPDERSHISDRHDRLFDLWGMPDDAQAELRSFVTTNDVRGGAVDVDPIEPGDRFPVGETTLEAVPLPGHTAGSVGFVGEVDGERVLFGGDAILPEYTPNVGGADVRVEDPLATYCETLAQVAEAAYDRVYPGHRDPIDAPRDRAVEILDHHRDRTAAVVDAIADTPADAWTVSARLFGDLSGIHVLHGPGEAWAHLEHLRSAGVVERTDGRYRLVERDPDLDALFPTVA